MTTRATTSSPTVDSPSTCSGHAITPIRPGRSDLSPRVFADMQRDAVALTWDLTVHQLHQAFARCLAAGSTELDAGASQELARTRLAAAKHAVEDIQAALSRMARGTYGRCRQCGCGITADRLQASPTARWCAACQV
jgi:RNA polymerase-binding transcription factor DksA